MFMKRVEKVTRLITEYNSYSQKMRKKLIERFECDGKNGNFIIEGEYPDSLIREIGLYLSEQHGILNQYQMWFSGPIQKWRLVFGRS